MSAPLIINLSVSARILLNAEALNMAESVGNYSRHRKAPVVIPAEDGYTVIYVPAVSGESLAHAYQRLLAQIAVERGLPVTQMDVAGYFMKFADDDIVKNYYADDLAKVLGVPRDKVADTLKEMRIKIMKMEMKPGELEKVFIKASVVADVGGFLYTSGTRERTKAGASQRQEQELRMLKRTSAVRFSYLLPTLDAIQRGGAVVTPQLHVRYTPEAREREQALFYVESGSAMYSLTAQIVLTDIGRTSYPAEEDAELKKQAPERVRAAVDALIALIEGVQFGAKRSRYLPQWDVKSLVVALSRGPVEFNVSPGMGRDYMKKTYARAAALAKAISGFVVNIYYYNDEGLEEPQQLPDVKQVTLEKASTPADALAKARDKALSILSTMGIVRG